MPDLRARRLQSFAAFLFVAFSAPLASSAIEVDGKPKPDVVKVDWPQTQSIGLATMIFPEGVVTVSGIECHSPGANAGISSMDRILEVDGKRIGSIEDFRRALHKARRKPSISLVVKRGGIGTMRSVTIMLPPGWAE